MLRGFECPFPKVVPLCGSKRSLLRFIYGSDYLRSPFNADLVMSVFFQPGYRLMVRTLVFRTNNAGSIPAGLIMLLSPTTHKHPLSSALRKKTRLSLVAKSNTPARFRYCFKFVTLVSPRSGYRPPFHQLGRTVSSPNRVCLKYSYLVAS